MLKRNPEERSTLSEILQDSELRKALENPLDGMMMQLLVGATVLGIEMLSSPCRTLVGHIWQDDIATVCLICVCVSPYSLTFSTSVPSLSTILSQPHHPNLITLFLIEKVLFLQCDFYLWTVSVSCHGGGDSTGYTSWNSLPSLHHGKHVSPGHEESLLATVWALLPLDL